MSDTEDDFPSLTIDIVGDVSCPWCFLGKRLIDAVIASVPRVVVELCWHPFEIQPGLPPDGMDYRSYLVAVVGPDKVEAALSKIANAGRDVGLELDVQDIPRLPDTFGAHRLIRRASADGVQSQVVERLFQAHFLERRNIGDLSVLIEVAAQSRMDRAATSAFLHGDEDVLALRQEMKHIRKGIDIVPHFTFGGTIEVIGLQSVDVFADALFNAIPEG